MKAIITRGPMVAGFLFWLVIVTRDLLPEYPEKSPESLILIPAILILGLVSLGVFISLCIIQWVAIFRKRIAAAWLLTLPLFTAATILLFIVLD